MTHKYAGYLYQGELYCLTCGDGICDALREQGIISTWDPDRFPKPVAENVPFFCAAGIACAEQEHDDDYAKG